MSIYQQSIFILFFAAQSFIVRAQENYPQNYFRDPLNIPIQLVSNFGELRSDHFHMGLDIRTQSRENLPVYAAAGGYISRIKIEKYGYGRAIYITHPNGYTTVYGHLNFFYTVLEKYLEDKQYKDKSWEQDFDLPANMFPVNKGQFIANSGNTGGSQGPHLHFEIRNSKTGDNINPLLFGLDMPDKIAPVIYGLYWYDRRYSTYVVKPQQIAIIKKNNSYSTQNKIVKVSSPLITLGIRMEDLNNASPFKLGVNHAALYMDDSLLFEFKLDEFSYDDTRYVNACMDYIRWIKNMQGIQYLSILPGNKLNIFTPLESDGKILLSDTSTHKIKIEVSDENKNTSTINFLLQYDGLLQSNYALPTNAIVCDANEKNNIESENAKLYFDKNAFYDALPLSISETDSKSTRQVSRTIHIGDYTIPVHDDYNIMIKKNIQINDAVKDKVVMQLRNGNSSTIKKGTWQGDWMLSSFDELGDANLMIDTIAPVIVPVGWKNNSVFKAQKTLTIKCTDDISRIVNFTATLDDNWLMFAKKNDYFIYTFDDHCSTGKHTLNVTVTDVAGNTTSDSYTFTKQ